jgi:hypothetical protein
MRRKVFTTHAQKGLHYACAERAALRMRRKDFTTHAQKGLQYVCAERAAQRRKGCTLHVHKGLHYACAERASPRMRRHVSSSHLDVVHEVTLNVLLELGREERGLGLLPAHTTQLINSV